jgi:hypothetical protein
VSKRVRGTTRRQRRPGARPATDRSTRPVERVSQLEAAEVVAEDIIEEHPVEAAAELERVEQAERAVHPRTRTKPGSLLAARAASEYIYVAQDMRRILAVAFVLFGALIVLWLLIVVFRVIPLPFY